MGGMFAKEPKKGGKAKPKPQITERDRAVLDLKLARDKIKKTMKAMDSEADKLTDQARVLVKSGRKDRALTVLRLRNMKVESARKADEELLNIEKMTMSIENAVTTVEIVRRMEAGTRVMQQLAKEMPLERVERIMEDNEDAIAAQREIDAAVARTGVDANVALDDDTLARELAALEELEQAEVRPPGVAEVAPAALPAAPTTLPMPAAPQGLPRVEAAPAQAPAQEDNDDDRAMAVAV